MYKEYHLGFIMVYLGHDIRATEESPLWYILYTSIPVLEKIGLDDETAIILRYFGITLSDLSRAYDEISSFDFNNMFNNVFITT